MKSKGQSRPPALQCHFGIGGGRFGPRCNREATNISTFRGEDCKGEAGPMGWCSEHGPSNRATPLVEGHGYRPVVPSDFPVCQSVVNEDEVEKIAERMFRRRISQEGEPLKGWNQICRSKARSERRPPREVIRDLLSRARRVTAGYFTTAVRGFHDHFIYWK